MKEQQKQCPECHQFVPREYTFNVSLLDGLLLVAMAGEVRRRMERMPFTEANRVHLPTIDIESNVQSRKTITSKMGLIAKVRGKGTKGLWLVTARGWAALRGDAVPSGVKTKQGAITARSDRMITLAGAFRTYPDSPWNPHDWFEIGETKESEQST